MRLLQVICGSVPVPLGMALVLVYGTLASATHTYAAVWRSEPTLWAYAVTRAPEKPRTLNNYGVALVTQGRLDEARQFFERAHRASHAAHLPPWDNVEGELRSRENLIALNTLIAELDRR